MGDIKSRTEYNIVRNIQKYIKRKLTFTKVASPVRSPSMNLAVAAAVNRRIADKIKQMKL